MTARILDGNALSAQVRGELAEQAAALTQRGVQPCLAVILVGDNPASAVYVRNKVAACEKAGIRSLKFDYPQDAEPAEVLAKIAELNADAGVHGILVQLPLPPRFDEKAVLEHTRNHLANFKIPRSVEFIDALPRNPGGKVVKPQLRELSTRTERA